MSKGSSINDVTHLGGGGIYPKGDDWRYSVSLFSEMGDIGEGGVKNLKKGVEYRYPSANAVSCSAVSLYAILETVQKDLHNAVL